MGKQSLLVSHAIQRTNVVRTLYLRMKRCELRSHTQFHPSWISVQFPLGHLDNLKFY